jgi:hypothetical protein
MKTTLLKKGILFIFVFLISANAFAGLKLTLVSHSGVYGTLYDVHFGSSSSPSELLIGTSVEPLRIMIYTANSVPVNAPFYKSSGGYVHIPLYSDYIRIVIAPSSYGPNFEQLTYTIEYYDGENVVIN